jgi:hypothetical protein
MADTRPPKRPRDPDFDFTPVILKTTDDGPNFKQMSIAAREAFGKEIVATYREPRDSVVLLGGDIKITPISRAQQSSLLSISQFAGRKIKSSLPNSAAAIRNGIIFGVPTSDHGDELLEALSNQNVTCVKRLPMRDSPHIPSENVILTFLDDIPDRVFVAAMSYRVQVSIPSPYKCKKCHRLGHTSSRCTLSSANCGNCGKTQHPDHPCATFCINCGSKSHGSGSYSCPAYTEMKQIIKMAFLEGITVKEARERFSAVQSSVARRGHHSPPTPTGLIPAHHDSNTQDIATLQEQIKALQLEMKTLKEVSIPTIQEATKNLAKDLAITNATVGSFEKKLDSIASSQTIVATQQADRFDKIDLLLNKLTLALTPSHLTHLQTNLNSTASQMSPMPASSHMDGQWEDHLLNPSTPWANTSSDLMLNANV